MATQGIAAEAVSALIDHNAAAAGRLQQCAPFHPGFLLTDLFQRTDNRCLRSDWLRRSAENVPPCSSVFVLGGRPKGGCGASASDFIKVSQFCWNLGNLLSQRKKAKGHEMPDLELMRAKA